MLRSPPDVLVKTQARRTFKHVMVPKVLVSLHKQNVQSLNQQSGTRQWAACEAHTGCVCAVMLLASRVGRVGTVHDGKGGQTRVVKFLEYKPPKPAGGGPKGSKSSAKAPDPNQAALDEIAKLTAAYQQTPWGKPK